MSAGIIRRMALRASDLHRLIRCVNFSALKHKDQRRKDSAGTPYINHPVGVAAILTDEADISDQDVIMAAILHDTVEDTDTTLEEIEKEFGQRIASIVAEVTDDKSLPKQKRKELQILNAPKSSSEAKLVKLADKLYNLRDLKREVPVGWSDQMVKEYFSWAARVIEGLKGTHPILEKKLDDVLT